MNGARRESKFLPRLVVGLGFVVLAYVIAAVSFCYDHLHPPATPNGDPSDYPPLTDSKAKDAG